MTKSIEATCKRFWYVLFLVWMIPSACSTVSYVGNRYAPTTEIDVYYAANDVKLAYEVIGHLSESARGFNGEEKAKQRIIAKCREVGADGVIILGFEHVKGETTSTYQKAEAIKYLD